MRGDVFPAEMAAVVPWVALKAVIKLHYPKACSNGGRRPFPLAVMLRIYCFQQRQNLSDPGAGEVLYDICSMRAVRRSGAWMRRNSRRNDHLELPAKKAVFAAVSELLEAGSAAAAWAAPSSTRR